MLTTNNPIAFIATNKPEASRAFYETTLGLTFVTDDQFAKDEPLLINRARTFFNVVSNGAVLPVGSASVELNSSKNTVFRLLFPQRVIAHRVQGNLHRCIVIPAVV